MTEIAAAPPDGATAAPVERLFGATIATPEAASVHLGGRLRFYRTLAGGGDARSGELAGCVGP
jgi:hypothetical protein